MHSGVEPRAWLWMGWDVGCESENGLKDNSQVFGQSHRVHVVLFTEVDEECGKFLGKRVPGLLLCLVSYFTVLFPHTGDFLLVLIDLRIAGTELHS